MTSSTKISCRVNATGPGLLLIAKLDGHEFWHGDPWGGQIISTDVSDDEGSHVLAFELAGKTVEHTKVDSLGVITQDVTVSIEDVSFDEIKLGHLMCELAVYHHDFNGTAELFQDEFYGIMGCNGTLSLKFTTPIYLWLLENM